MQTFIKSVIAPVVMVILISSCGKKSEIVNSLTTTIAGRYKITGLTIYSNNQTLDVFSKLSSCIKDDLEIFNADGTYELPDLGVKCSPSTDLTGKWRSAGNVLLLEIDGIPVSVKIESNNGNKLILSADGSVNLETGNVRGYWTKTLEKIQ